MVAIDSGVTLEFQAGHNSCPWILNSHQSSL